MPLPHNCNFEYFMGQCASPAAGTRRQTNFFECEPVGTEALKDKQLPKLLFHSVLANVKIKNYPFVLIFRLRKRQRLCLRLGKVKFLLWQPRIMEKAMQLRYLSEDEVEDL